MGNGKWTRKTLHPSKRDRMMEIIATVSNHLDVPIHAILGATRPMRVAEARQIAMFLCREVDFTSPEIGAVFGRDHTTILHAVNVVTSRQDLRDIAYGMPILV